MQLNKNKRYNNKENKKNKIKNKCKYLDVFQYQNININHYY